MAAHDHAQPREGETPDEALDRNWNELLQELRVMQTGVQLLAGLLLTLPFQQRFAKISASQHNAYLIAVAAAFTATLLLVAPVPLHRLLFHQHERRTLVAVAHWCALLGAAVLGVAVVAVCALVFGVVSGSHLATVAATTAAGLCAFLWLLGPLLLRQWARP